MSAAPITDAGADDLDVPQESIDLSAGEADALSAADYRFWAKVDASGDCWRWTGATNGRGYGVLGRGPRGAARRLYAHRYAFELRAGPIPGGLEIDHRCHNEAAERGECDGGVTCPHRACVNPAHLEAVTRSVNLSRSPIVGGWQRRLVDCKNGHPLSGENLYVLKGGRRCRTCLRAAQRRYRAKAAKP